ncbi:hypothetical protein JVU11DRAFT_2431 [Chiua virens]|nr:hypothetical protein JVU11DRAFT_2431 [Chiua virens]
MSIDIIRGHDSFFGPPSEHISIRKFLDDTTQHVFTSASDVLDHPGWQNLSEDERAAVAVECSAGTTELKAAVEEVWNNPMLSAHLHRAHASAVNAVYSQAGGLASKGRKRKHLPDPEAAETQPEVRALQKKLDAISLRCWALSQGSALFMRASKHSDYNALKCVKTSSTGCGTLTGSHPGPSSTPSARRSESLSRRDALVTLTVTSVLSSQTLADAIRAIPCEWSDMPTEVVDAHGNLVGYRYEDGEQGPETAARTEGCLLLIEGLVYGDGRPGDDYADKLLSHLESTQEQKRPQITKSPTSLSQTPLASLSIRVNQPYWMLHRGNCEHFVVVDEIRHVAVLTLCLPNWI